MRIHYIVAPLLLASLTLAAADRPLAPTEARKQIGMHITVQMTVRAAKNRIEKRGEIYLDSEESFRDEKNFAVVITKGGAARFAAGGVADPAEYFRSKTIRATGTVKEVENVPRIEVDDPAQIKIIEN